MRGLLKRQEETVEHNPYLERGKREACDATFWVQATPGTTYWRCLVPARHLPGQAIPFTNTDLGEKDGRPFLPRQRGVAVWQFLGDEMRSRVALGMRQLNGTPTFIEVDDNYTREAPHFYGKYRTKPWYRTKEEARKPGNSGYSYEAHKEVVPFADGIICATEYLADIYSDWNHNVHVCPNSVDPDDWQYEREEHDDFRIVYYGSSSHGSDTPIVTKALKWAAKQPGVTVYTVGINAKDWSFPHVRLPWSNDLVEARKTLFQFDLGIAPLKANVWSKGKSDVKALEYAMAGVCPLVSAVEPYKAWEYHGLTVEDDEWQERLKWAIENQDEVKAVAADAKDYVLNARSIQANIHHWREVIA